LATILDGALCNMHGKLSKTIQLRPLFFVFRHDNKWRS
jgi:hypothetical protein